MWPCYAVVLAAINAGYMKNFYRRPLSPREALFYCGFPWSSTPARRLFSECYYTMKLPSER